MEKRWNIQQVNESATADLQSVLKVNNNLCRILVQRGIDDY
jgi:single-stranded-DNA-specific exonuclease